MPLVLCAEVYGSIVARMGWHGLMADALRWQLPGSSTAAAVSAAERGRFAGELVRRCPLMVCVLLKDLRSPPWPTPAGRDGSARAAAGHQPDSTDQDATGSRKGFQPTSAAPNSITSARDEPAGTWSFASALLQALHVSFHRVASRHDTLQRVMLQAVGEFCTWLLRWEHRSAPQLTAAGSSGEGRPSAESVLRTAVTIMHDMLSDWGPAAAVSADSAECYRSAMAGLLDALNAALARDLAAMAAGGSSTPAFQERFHLKARLLLCSVSPVSCIASPDDYAEAAPASDSRPDVVRARNVFSDAVTTAALRAALRREYIAAHLCRHHANISTPQMTVVYTC